MEVQTSPSETDISAVRAAVQAGVQAAVAAGADRRYVFTGLWSAAIGSVLDTAPLKTLAAVLEDYAGSTPGAGLNADSPPLQFDPDERTASALIVCETVLSYLEPIHESFEDDGRDAFAAILDVVFAILGEVWGPYHLRKNLALQSSAFREGVASPVIPVEPEARNRKPQTRQEAHPDLRETETASPQVQDIEEAEGDEPMGGGSSPVLPEFYIPHSRREIDVVIEVSSWGDGSTGIFGVATSLGFDEGFPEIREFSGHLRGDNTGRLTPLVACVETLRKLGPPAAAETVRLGINADFIVAAQGSSAGLPGEEALWADLEIALAGREVHWHVPGGGVGTDLGRRSNRLTHERATQLSKSGVS